MSFYLPECNMTLTGNLTPVKLALPTTAMVKAANTGSVTAFWMRTPAGGYDQNAQRNYLSRSGGGTGGADAYIASQQAATSVIARFRNAGNDYAGAAALSCSITPGATYLVMFIVTAANVHLVVCAPGGTPVVSSVSSATLYALNLSAATMWDTIGCGTSSGVTGQYGPMEEVCFWTGLFPEASNIPDSATIQALANGTQDLATFHSVLTSGVKKARYRMLTCDDLTDSFGVTTSLTPVNTTTDKMIQSSGPLRPVVLTPAFSTTCAAQLTFATPGSTTGATAVIRTPAGTYSGISPAAIQARLLKEDRTVLTTWETVAIPASGAWAEGRFAAAQPYTAGWLEIQFKAIDGGGAQLGDIVSAYGWTGTGINMISESQSQLIVMYQNGGSGVILATTARAQVSYFGAALTLITKSLCATDPITRVGQGIRQAITEINALFPGMPVSLNAVGVVGTPITDFLAGGAYVGNWAALKAMLGVTQDYFLLLFGHSSVAAGTTGATFQGLMTSIRTICESTFGAARKMILCPTARYAGAGTSATYDTNAMVRTAMRDLMLANPSSTLLGGSWQTIKNDAADVGPHPAALNVGQGRSGSYLGFALLAACRAVKQQPLQIAKVIPSGTTIRLKFGPVNAL